MTLLRCPKPLELGWGITVYALGVRNVGIESVKVGGRHLEPFLAILPLSTATGVIQQFKLPGNGWHAFGGVFDVVFVGLDCVVGLDQPISLVLVSSSLSSSSLPAPVLAGSPLTSKPTEWRDVVNKDN